MVEEFNKIKVLIVEDDVRIQKIYEIALSEQIFKKRIIGEGSAAVDIYLEWSPDIIILDIMLPDITGYSILSGIRTVDKSTTIIMATAIGDKSAVNDCILVGIQGYIVKPFKMKELNEKILGFYSTLNEAKAMASIQLLNESTIKTKITLDKQAMQATQYNSPFDIRKSVEEIYSSFSSTLKIANIILSTNSNNEEIIVIGNMNDFNQVLINLVKNSRAAILANRKKTGQQANTTDRIDVTITKENEGVFITVSDTGGGIAENIVGMIFDPYFTSGVGLNTSKKLLEKMGWKITAKNIEHGAEFRIDI
ncbi:MAG: hybrid sensor histidine kinase/response regulator [Nitrospirae bacterium]|nr:hybrid sensor histidine kinase/response regulator [Nitrospirota bacterium]